MARIPSVLAAPWIGDTNVTHAWSLDIGPVTDSGIGTTISAIAPTNGSQTLNAFTTAVLFEQGFASRNANYANHQTSAGASFIAAPVGAAESGTAVPFSFAICGQLPAAPNYSGASGGQWVLFSLARSTTATPFIAVLGSRGSTDCVFRRRNNGNVVDDSSNLSLGTTPFVLVGIYSGTTMTTILNGAVIDNAISAPAGGACTLDTFTVGAITNNSYGLVSDLNWTDLVLGVNKTWAPTTYNPIQTFLRRKAGV